MMRRRDTKKTCKPQEAGMSGSPLSGRSHTLACQESKNSHASGFQPGPVHPRGPARAGLYSGGTVDTIGWLSAEQLASSRWSPR